MAPVFKNAAAKRLALLLAAAAVLTVGVVLWFTRPAGVNLTGESESSTAGFSLLARRYALSAELLPQCQYTFYLTPQGKTWNREGKAVAAASGETALHLQTDLLAAGRYFLHAYTAPDEGCSWALKLEPD